VKEPHTHRTHRQRIARARWRRSHENTQGKRCYYCRVPFVKSSRRQTSALARQATLDHLTPLSRGGRDTFENTVAACHACNQAKGSLTEAEFNAARGVTTHMPAPPPSPPLNRARPAPPAPPAPHAAPPPVELLPEQLGVWLPSESPLTLAERLRIAVEEVLLLQYRGPAVWHRMDVRRVMWPVPREGAEFNLYVAVTLADGRSWGLSATHGEHDAEAALAAILSALLRAVAANAGTGRA